MASTVTDVDYLIVGQGLAGSLLAWELLQAGAKVQIIDSGHLDAASKVAAGIINPVTGRRFAKSWMIDELLPFVNRYYRQLEQHFDASFFHSRSVLRLLHNNKDVNEWYTRGALPEFSIYLKDYDQQELWADRLHLSFGMGEIVGAAQVDLPKLTNVFCQYFLEQGCLQQAAFDYDQLIVQGEGIEYGEYTARRLIFCEGVGGTQNPFFNHLPFEPAKGEVLIVRAPDLQSENIIKSKAMIAPLGNDLYWCGSNYEWNPPHAKPTAAFRERFEPRIAASLKVPFEVVDHIAAIRPSVKDRRPLLGQHDRHPALYMFNGLGTKGASLGPYWASVMADYLTQGKVLPETVDIQRFSLTTR